MKYAVSMGKLMDRVSYGGRKGRSAIRRLLRRKAWTYEHPEGSRLVFTFVPITFVPSQHKGTGDGT